jgi:hypothetical protein
MTAVVIREYAVADAGSGPSTGVWTALETGALARLGSMPVA